MSPAELQQKLQDLADRLAEAFSLPSSAAALTVHGETVYAFTGEASEESVFPIASMTKSFLAAALCAAQDEGKLLTIRLESSPTLAELEETAVTRLGMQHPTQGQLIEIEYLG